MGYQRVFRYTQTEKKAIPKAIPVKQSAEVITSRRRGAELKAGAIASPPQKPNRRKAS